MYRNPESLMSIEAKRTRKVLGWMMDTRGNAGFSFPNYNSPGIFFIDLIRRKVDGGGENNLLHDRPSHDLKNYSDNSPPKH